MKVVYLETSALLRWIMGQRRPFPIEPVRNLDAIHLATALEFAAVFPDLRVLSYDDRVRKNAVSLGIA